MARPLRVEFPGATYHVTSRGDRREAIFVDDADRVALLGVVEQALDRFDAQMPAYCLMGNHYHFVVHTRCANLSLLMRHINGVYSQRYNRRHRLVGHLLQGRFKAILVDRDSYLLQVCRYVELNPVRASLIDQPAQWTWSSYRSHVGLVPVPRWLDTAGLHGFLLGNDVRTPEDSRRAARQYANWVAAGRDVRLWDDALNRQVFLGDDAFVERMQALIPPAGRRAQTIPLRQRSTPKGLPAWLRECSSREEALWMAHTRSGLTMTALAAELGLSVARVSQLIARVEADRQTRSPEPSSAAG